MYTFVHITKTGGTSIENHFRKHYSTHIKGGGHVQKCTNQNNPIIIFRDPIDRFLSIYKYWKNGSSNSQYKREQSFISKHDKTTIKQFISYLKQSNVKMLHHNFTWNQHFHPQTSWINGIDTKNMIVMIYCEDLNCKVETLLEKLDIKKVNVVLPKNNISLTKSTDNYSLDEEDINFVKTYFKSDFDMQDLITNHPENFKLVI
jgi:mannose/fructose/N-acetylgalactosamine-specific phosphotransferase system component IIB